MEDLRSLAKIISRNKISKSELLGNGSRSNKIQDLYKILLDEPFKNEEETIALFFPKNEFQKSNFARLKRHLKERMINSLFLIDVNEPHFNDFQRAYYTCFKNATAVKILIGRFSRIPAISIAEKTIKKAIKFDFTDIILSLAKELRMHYGTIEGERRKYEKYNSLVNKYSKVYNAELLAEEYYSDLIINFVNSRATNLQILKKAKSYSHELEQLIKNINSYRFNFLAYLVFVLRYEIENNYTETLKTCQQALSYFQSKKHLSSKNAIFNFQFKILACHIQLKNYKAAEDTAKKCLELPPVGSRNWYYTLEYYLILSFHSKNFEKAFHIYQQAISNPNYTQQYQSASEQWRVYEAYIYYFLSIGKIDHSQKEPVKKFRLNKFLNEVPTYSKDKKGINISIIILHILFLLQQKKYGVIIDRMESLKTYAHRYLRKDDTYRSNCFIKMLMQLPAADFHRQGVLRKAQKYWEKLQEVPLEVANQSAEIEIVPYEMLWEFVLESLDDRFH